MSAVTYSLGYLTAAVYEALGGDISEIFEDSFIERTLNAGQARYEPDLLRERTSATTWLDDATSFALPSDFAFLDRLMPDADNINTPLPDFTTYAGSMLFNDPNCVRAWTGTLLYRAHFPAITESQVCLLPATACDGLISFALHACFRRLAAGRAEYKRYSTIVGANAVSVSELEQIAQLHLQDFEDGRASALTLPPPSGFYS